MRKFLFFKGLAASLAVAALPLASFAECPPTSVTTAEQAYATAYQFAQQQKWEDTIAALQSGLEACKEHWTSWELMAQSKMRLKDFEGSAVAYGEIVSGKHGGDMSLADERILKPYGFVAYRAGDLKTARLVHEGILTQDPMNASAHQMLVNVYTKRKNYEKAIEYATELYSLDAENQGRTAKTLGDLHKAKGESSLASEWYSKAGSAGVAGKGAFDMGLDALRGKDYASAAKQFESYVAGKPESVAGWKNLGLARKKLGKLKDAATAYEKALAIDPSRHGIAHDLAWAYWDMGQVSKANELATQAVNGWGGADDKWRGGMFYLKGKILEKQENYESAISMFEKITADPTWGDRAKQEITRQGQLIERREIMKRQGR